MPKTKTLVLVSVNSYKGQLNIWEKKEKVMYVLDALIPIKDS